MKMPRRYFLKQGLQFIICSLTGAKLRRCTSDTP